MERIIETDLIAEARRLGQADWCLSVPDIAKAVLNSLADDYEHLIKMYYRACSDIQEYTEELDELRRNSWNV